MSDLSANSLQQLWNSLHRLFLHLSHDLRNRHLNNSQISEPKEVMDIWEMLSESIENVPVIKREEKKSSHSFWKRLIPKKEKHMEPFQETIKRRDNPTEHILKNIHVHEHAHVKDQMYRNAMDHINTAYFLAQKGDQSGAKLHIELSENAVHTASRFMDDEEYRQFEERILNRIKRFIN